MGFVRRTGSSWATPGIVRRREGNGWADVQNVYRRSGNSWVPVWTAYTPMRVSISPNPGSASGLALNASRPPRPGTAAIPFDASVQGGKPPYSFRWDFATLGGSTASFSPNGSSITVSLTSSFSTTSNGEVLCTITDATGAVASVKASFNLYIDSDV